MSGWVVVDQTRIDQFATCTGDNQWIHVDAARTVRESPFGAPIAHGYLSLSLVAAMLIEIGIIAPDAASGLNYGLDKVRFLAPVKAGERVRLRVVLLGVEPKDAGGLVIKTRNTLEIEGSDKPALIAEALALLIPEKAPGAGGAT